MPAPRHFRLTSSAAEVVVELAHNPQQFADLIGSLRERRFTGQILVDFRRGCPQKVGFPQVVRVPVVSTPRPRSTPSNGSKS